jgi:hypothetical protein
MQPLKNVPRLVLATGVLFSAAAVAADIDGALPLTCIDPVGYSCEPGKAQCGKVEPETKIEPQIFIDPANKMVKTPYRADPLPIANSVLNSEQLLLQGTANRFAWSAVINRKTGKLTVTIGDRLGAYVIFGRCQVPAHQATQPKSIEMEHAR